MNNRPLLGQVLTSDALRELADERTLGRGMDYFKRNLVTLTDVMAGEVVAEVVGGDIYEVRLFVAESGRFGYACDCPVGDDGVFCKHAVATALAWFAQGEKDEAGDGSAPPTTAHARPRPPHTQVDVIFGFLLEQDESTLRQLILEGCQISKRLREKVLLMARMDKGSAIGALKAAVRQATRISGFLDWQDAHGYAEQLEDLATMLTARIADGDKRLVDVLEMAIAHAESALEHIDDSNGHVFPAIEALQKVHLEACLALRPDPVALAERLLAFQMEGQWDTFSAVLPQYRTALGAEGLRHYEALLRERWDALPVLGSEAKGQWDAGRYSVEQAMEALARTTGDIHAVAAVLEKNLSNATRFQKLVQLHQEHGDLDQALQWAMAGLEAFGYTHTTELADFAINLHIRREDKDAAQAVAWSRFAATPDHRAFYQLLDTAKRLGRKRELEKQALWLLGDCMRVEEAKETKPTPWQTHYRSELLAIAIQSKQSDQAWELFRGGKTAKHLWEPLAALRAPSHPQDALTVYRILLPLRVDEGRGNARYESAFAIVKAMQAVYRHIGQLNKFQDELVGWKSQWRSKRNFMKLLAVLG